LQSLHWHRVKLVVEQALGCPRAARAAFVAQACGDDDGVRTEVESLLEMADDDDFLETPASLPPAPALPERIGQRFGAYRLERQLGRGGMGEVYLAARDDELLPARREQVVLKMPRQDLDTPEMRRRLEHEGRLLGRLHHPGIALLRGSGRARTLPFLMLEYVDGIAIDAWCRRHAIGVLQRIDLVIALCDAVAHAHERGVVHRDIKAGNVLVTAEGRPKLLDFGIAQPLNADEMEPGMPSFGRQHGVRGATRDAIRREESDSAAFTGECAAPEQVRNQPSTTATDVHGLAGLAYRLLTGQTPHDSSTHTTVVDTMRAICHEDPLLASVRVRRSGCAPEPGLLPPDRMASLLHGDVDALLAAALSRDPQCRPRDALSLNRAFVRCRRTVAQRLA